MNSKLLPEIWQTKLAIDCFDQISTTNSKVKSKDCSPEGLYPVIDQGQNYISGYINDDSKVIKVDSPICIFGDHTRIVKWVTDDFVPGADGTKLLQPKAFIHPRYAYYSLCALNIPDKGYSRHFKYFKELEINLPGRLEQKIIAEKLDTLLAQVDSTKARLKQIPQILKRFRQAVLAAAASGRLTNKWRENYTQKEEINLIASKYKPTDSLFKQAKLSLPEIPQSWYAVPSAHLIGYVTSGSRGWANYYSTEGALFLRMSNVRYNTTKLDLQDLQFVNLPSQVEGKRSLVQIDDLIISLTADVGRVARIDKDLGEAYINQHLALLRPNNNINSEFFALCIAAQNIGVKQIQSLKRGATKVGLGLDDIRSLAIPLPSLPEQAEIVRRVEQLFAYADTIEKQVNNALTRVNSLTQSTLAKAFRGELTAQWRAENPNLISGENSAASSGKKTSRKKA